jgi:hypothetical protein
MKKVFTFIMVLLCLSGSAFSQKLVRISGFVSDQQTGEMIIGAVVIDSLSKQVSATDYNGFYSIYTQSPVSLNVSFLGYRTLSVRSTVIKDTVINFKLEPGNEIGEVVITAGRETNGNISSMGIEEIIQIPSLGGKSDVGKSLQLLPGISSTSEASSVLMVRGGDPGQNRYLFDNVPVIYVNHLGGFLSVFNPDIINKIDVYKGAFPSNFGGKLSSVINIAQKEGDISGLKGNIGIGLSDISFSIEGPTKIKNSSFILTGRKTLFDALLALSSYTMDGNNVVFLYGFHDINAKYTWKPDRKTSLNVNLYYGDDYIKTWLKHDQNNIGQEYIMSNTWGNMLYSVQHKKMFDNGFYLKSGLSYTRYRLRDNTYFEYPTDSSKMTKTDFFLSTVQDITLFFSGKLKFGPNIESEIGIQSSFLMHLPSYSSSTVTRHYLKSSETALFMENRINFLRHNTLLVGFRPVFYMTDEYTYISPEPRISLNIRLNESNSLNIGYMRVAQFSHLLHTQGNIMNNEIWIPAGKTIPPAIADQFTCGWNSNEILGRFLCELNFYYKKMDQLSTYKEGFLGLPGDEHLETKIETGGRGIAKGMEVMIKKTKGKFTGFVSYSLSNSTRQYPGINNGNAYLYEYDRLHSGSVSLSYRINDKLTLNALWVYQSGLPYTPVIGRQLTISPEPDVNGNYRYFEAFIYGERNSARVKDYHRLDLGINYETLTKRKRKAVLSFSLYNAYNRHNPYYYYYNNNASPEIYNPETEDTYKPVFLYQMSFFPIIPSISYKVYFDSNDAREHHTFKQNLINWLYHEN